MLDRVGCCFMAAVLWHVLGVLFLVNALEISRATKELYAHNKPSQLNEQLLLVTHTQLKHGQHYTPGSSNLNNGANEVVQSMLKISWKMIV
jgi:hypothetical protein